MTKDQDAGSAALNDKVADDNDASGKDGPCSLTPIKAYTVPEFCRVFGLGKTYTHNLISRGTLKKRYAGKRLLITADSAASWFDNLPDQPPRNRVPPPLKLGVTRQ